MESSSEETSKGCAPTAAPSAEGSPCLNYSKRENLGDTPTTEPRFEIDDRVFAKDGGKEATDSTYYPATIRAFRRVDGSGNPCAWQYKVHYHGWNSRWDKWLGEDRVLLMSQSNRKALEDSNLLEVSCRTGSSSIKKGSDMILPSNESSGFNSKAGVKRKRDDSNANRGNGSATTSILSVYEDLCILPLSLKIVLLDEKGHITRRGHELPYTYDMHSSTNAEERPNCTPPRLLHELPADVSIKYALNHFCKRHEQFTSSVAQTQQSQGDSKEDNRANEPDATTIYPSRSDAEEFCTELCKLFESALPKILLYPQERPQYQFLKRKAAQSKTSMAEIYGCEFLLRLYLRLPPLMVFENTSNIKMRCSLLSGLLVFLQKNRHACFKGRYREPTPEEWLPHEMSS